MSAVKDRGTRNPEKRMSLGEHLLELRKRLFISAIAIAVGMVFGWILTDLFVWQAIQEPVNRVVEAQAGDEAPSAGIIFPTISSAFDLRLQIAFTLGIVISAPVWLYQVFAFLVPGLNSKERKYTFAFFATAIPLFFAGCAAGWFVLPNIVKLMTSFVPEGAQTLLTAGADVNEAAVNGVTPLMAAAYAGNVDMTRALLARGADPLPVDRIGKNAMTYAAGEGHTEIVRLLLAKGVDPNAVYRNDLTALMWAAGYGHTATVRVLLDAGARVEPVDNRGKSALDMAREFHHAETVEVLERSSRARN